MTFERDDHDTDKASVLADEELDAEIRRSLNSVYDPCSVAANVPIGLADMGLLVDWRWESPRQLLVLLCVTSGGCMMAPVFVKAAEKALAGIPGVDVVHVDITTRTFWSEDRIAGSRRAQLGARRERSSLEYGVAPQQWRNRASVPSQLRK